jgi:hypothetical protein
VKPVAKTTVAVVAILTGALFGRPLMAQEPGSFPFGQYQDHAVDRHGLNRPPSTFADITLSPAQASQVRALDRQFGEFFVAHNNRVRETGGDLRDSASRQPIQAAHLQLLANIRKILTAEQRTVFDRNQSARNAYLAQRKALGKKKTSP